MTSILITGGTGSFGQAFVKHLLAASPFNRIVVLSRSEHVQASMAEQFKARGNGRLRFFIGDVRDRDRLKRAFEGVDIVVHAAALKRIEVGHYNPTEMVKTNVLGAMNVVEAAQDAGVKKVIGISSDKAWQPISPYGQTKALAETILLSANNTVDQDHGPKFVVVRYGNVAGSAGSVIPRWREIIHYSAGIHAPVVPITDPDCTRFWMLMDEAVGLVNDAIQRGNAGDVIIPTLPAYRLADLAEAMGVRTVAKGLPPWEKKHEGMADDNTSDQARRLTVDELRSALASVP